MTKPQYRIEEGDEFSGATIYLNGETITVSSQNPKWDDIIAHLLSGKGSDADNENLLLLTAPAKGVSKTMQALTDRSSYHDGLFRFDGDILDNSLTNYIVKLVEEGASAAEYAPFVAFLEKLYQNPSIQSREHLFHYLDGHGLHLHTNGDFIAYKGVKGMNAEGKGGVSTHSGYGIVDGVIFENDYLPNEIGSVVSIPRSMVDDNRGVACSTGLHAGTFQFSKDFGQRLVVLINPRDVVSVPSDANNQKLRVARYKVIEVASREYTEAVSNFDIPDAPAPVADPAAAEPEVQPVVKKKAKFTRTAPVKVASAKAEDLSLGQDAVKVKEFEKVIKALLKSDPKVKLSVYKNKRVTAGQRANFKQAATNLGYEA